MSQNDLVIANQSFPATRADINSALQALGSLNSGSTAPTTTYANMLWYDTTNNTLKMRSEADDVWISVGYLNQSTDEFSLFDDTKVVNTSGTQTGIIGDQATSSWEVGTSTTESLVSPAKVKAAIEALAPDVSIGVGQSWASVTRTSDVSYRNTTGRPIQLSVTLSTYAVESGENFTYFQSTLEVSSDNSAWVEVCISSGGAGGRSTVNTIVPDDHYYRFSGQYANFAVLS